jgi:CheY-like chemotaxis protein
VRILVVEDSPLVQKMYGLAFSQRQNTLVTCDNGRDALDILSACGEAFELILLDLRMPDMNGVEFLKAVRRHGLLTPIILTTAERDDSPLLVEAQALGVDAVVHKPWKPHELKDLALRVLEGKTA